MSFDGLTVAYYAAVCGALASLAPRLRSSLGRVAVGAAIGVLAATLFPSIRSALGF